MKKYRFKTKEEFQDDDRWVNNSWTSSLRGFPEGWADGGEMNKYLGQEVPDDYYSLIENQEDFKMDGWHFNPDDVIEEPEVNIEETLEQVKQLNPLKTKKTMAKTAKTTAKKNPVAEKFVFMDKTVSILNVGFSTAKNVILYGPGE